MDQMNYLTINIFMGKPKQKQLGKKQSDNECLAEDSEHSQEHLEQQDSGNIQSLSAQQVDQQQSEESPPYEAAIKTISFRAKRGAKMKDLMRGKIDKDQFWEKNNVYFGGDLKGKDQDEHESEYEASSSGRDEFDSDFDLTDSYPGKRGRKKGQKVKRKIKRNGGGKPRGRPKKNKEENQEEDDQANEQSKNVEQKEKKKKKIFKQVPSKPTDVFIVYKAVNLKKKPAKINKESQKQEQEIEKESKIQEE